MWSLASRPAPSPRVDPTAFVIAPHHPDRLRRPLPSIPTADQAFRQAVLWNVFRTLELIAPAYWLRRFHLRLTGESSIVAPQIATVRLWPSLPLPPIRRIDGGRGDVVADVAIETEHDMWTLLAADDRALTDLDEWAADAVDAGGWLAGRRSHHCGVIEADAVSPGPGEILGARYRRSRQSAALRSTTRGPVVPAGAAWGVVRWADLAALLRDCAQAPELSAIERTLAAHAGEWLRSVGIAATDAGVSA